jgi:hypothetical protein
VASKTCVGCLSSANCSTTAQPICDGTSHVCRGCLAHSECTTKGGGMCALDGTCPAESAISYVDDSNTGGTANGSKQYPYKKIADALGKAPKYIFVKAGTYGDSAISKSHEIYGEKGAVIAPTSCDNLTIEASAKVVLAGFTIKGNLKIKDGGTKATIVENVIGPSSCVGVNASGGDPTLVLRRNLVWKHTGGGLFVDGYYTIVNNFIVKSGSATADFGGVKLKPQTSGQTFANNTVADNVSEGNDAAMAAVRCEGTVPLHNSIVWNNTNTVGKAKQLDPTCVPHSCDVADGLVGPFPDADKNISSAPNFKGGSGALVDPWRIVAPSPCDGKADPTKAPTLDYDRQRRSVTAPDIGADEI